MSKLSAKPHNQGFCKPDCFGCKADRVGFSSLAMPTRHSKVEDTTRFVNTMTKDKEAYDRLRKEGYQPKAVRGASEVEQFANSRFEVESGHRLSSAAVGKKFDETQKYLTSEGLKPLAASVAE